MMKKQILLLAILLSNAFVSSAKNYYISGTGSDSKDGSSTTLAFRNIQKAANLVNAGDTVFVMNGTYKSTLMYDVVNITRKGTASQWIVFINYPNHKPKIEFDGWAAFAIQPGAAYIEINGFDIEGNNKNVKLDDALNQSQGCKNPGGDFLPKYNGNGIASDGRYGTPALKPHHLRILNNQVHDCGGGGISAIHTDYVTIKNNLVYNNAWYTIFGASGISLYQLWDFDNNTTDVKNVIEGNICHHNRLYVPWVYCPCCFSDGNGIIIDDTNNTQNGSTLGVYKGKTVIQNNIVYQNGGSGIHSYESQHVTIVNNTAYKNSQTPEIDGGEIFSNASNDIKITNNILYAENGNAVNSNYKNTNILYENNLHFNGTKTVITSATCLEGNPNFENEALLDFHLKSNSPCINKGNSTTFSAKDFDGKTRPSVAGNKPAIGAFEYRNFTPVADVKSFPKIKIYPNPTSGILTYETTERIDKIVCFNILGTEIKPKIKDKTLDFSENTEGTYRIIFYRDNKVVGVEGFVKRD
jgi:parallel beta-helix repeat protein